MATTFKTLLNNDVASTRTLLHEAVPITGTIVSGTYSDSNIKNFSHGMFQSVYDYPYLSSSANHIFDITMGYSSNAGLSSSAATQNSKKINIYNQMAQVLMGHDADGNIREFDRDGDLLGTTTDSMRECFFLNFARLLVKDEIKKGSFQLTVATASAYSHGFDNAGELTLYDTNAENEYRSNSPAGEYGLLYTASTFTTGDHTAQAVGQVFYQAGVVVLTSSLWGHGSDVDDDDDGSDVDYWVAAADDDETYKSVQDAMFSGSISGSADGLRNRIKNIQFNNTTELNSTIYFCRANHNEFNYSSNPTYVNDSKMRVKNVTSDSPVSYITTVGLYSADNELLAVAKLSEPLTKTPENEITLRVRLDY